MREYLNINTTLTVDRTPITKPHELNWQKNERNDYGSFTIAEENLYAAKVTSFDIENDITFVSAVCDNRLISGEEKAKRLAELGYVPLDIYCLRALLQQKEWQKYIRYLQEKQWSGLHSPQVAAFDFPGTILLDDSHMKTPHFFHINFRWNTTAFGDLKEICPVEIRDEAWGISDPSVVFTRDFSKQLMTT